MSFPPLQNFVVDASATIELLLNSKKGRLVAQLIGDGGALLHAPHLVDLEVAQVVRRLESAKLMSKERARTSMRLFLDLSIERYAHDALLPRIWELRDSFTAYDAAYIVLAEMLSFPLLTCDKKLARASHQARIQLV